MGQAGAPQGGDHGGGGVEEVKVAAAAAGGAPGGDEQRLAGRGELLDPAAVHRHMLVAAQAVEEPLAKFAEAMAGDLPGGAAR